MVQDWPEYGGHKSELLVLGNYMYMYIPCHRFLKHYFRNKDRQLSARGQGFLETMSLKVVKLAFLNAEDSLYKIL